jgi:O-antigen ligase
MPENVRALIVVLLLSVPAFYIGRPVTASIVAPREFAVWRNAWLASTVAAFLTGSFLLFAAIVLMICLYARANRAATVALFFVLLFAVPLGSWQIGGLDIVQSLFELNNARLLGIVLLLPILLATGNLGRRNGGAYSISDLFVVGYVLLDIALRSEQFSVTQLMRFGTVQTLDVLIPYFAFSRAITTTSDIHRVLLAFIIAVLPLSMIAAFEFIKHWHLYAPIANEWGEPLHYLSRDGMLRGSAIAFTSIALGFIIMVAIGCVLAVRQSTMLSPRFTALVLAIFAVGLIATLARGPWVGTLVLVLVYLGTGRNAVANIGLFVVIGAVALVFLLLTPVGDRLLDLLPFIGSVDAGSVTYREHLFENSMRVIEQNPWFGSADYLSTPEMKEMIQGERIIDIVNTYLGITLSSGLVGLGFFLSFFGSILISLRRVLKNAALRQRGFNTCARALMATLVAMLVTISTVSSVDFIPYVYWSIAGLSVALLRIVYRERAAVTRGVHAIPA